MRWPSKKAVYQDLLGIRDEARTYAPGELEDDGIEVRLQVLPSGEWGINTGDPQYDTDHRGFWGSGFVGRKDSAATLKALAEDLIGEAQDDEAQSR